MPKWSGLAPAVDAHLARWQIMRRVAERTIPLTSLMDFEQDGPEQRAWAEKTIRSVYRTDAGDRWLVFAKSYGLSSQGGASGRAST